MNTRRIALLAVASILACTLASCGSGDEAAAPTASSPAETGGDSLPPEIAMQANRNCQRMLREVRHVGHEAKSGGYGSVLELTTEGFAKPGLRLVKGLAARQQELRSTAETSSFDVYVDLFDPLIALGERGLRAGQAGDSAQVQHLQDLLTKLGEEQRQAARLAGLADCEVDFLNALVRAAT